MDNDQTFIAPEGVYSTLEEHKPTAPTHLAPPALYPTKLATVHVRFPHSKQPAPGLGQLLTTWQPKEKDKDKGPPAPDGASISSSDTPDAEQLNHSDDPLIEPPATPHLFGSAPLSAHGSGRRAARPKQHNLRTTSSTFVTRLHGAEGLSKTLGAKAGEVTYLFYNAAKNFYWAELGVKAKEPLARISFSAYPTCHDVNQHTAAHDRLDVVVGFASGDLIWFDPVSLRYARINKQGRITASPCTAVRWVPSSPNLFLASHADGTIIVYDKDRDDGAFTPGAPRADGDAEGEWNPLDSMFVTMPPWHPVGAAASGGEGKKEKADKAPRNPVSHWKVSKRAIVDFVFSPDVKYVAAISEDGCLRVIDALAEQLMDCYAAYFGALTSVAWSPDGRFIITGGQDDLVHIFSPWEGRVIARCQGHSSFVSALAFDDSRCDGRTYRFGSVGEDNKLILWDFSSGILHRPKHAPHTMSARTGSTSSLRASRRREGSTLHLPPGDGPLPRYHPAPSRNEVAVVQPVLVKQLDGPELLVGVQFLPRHVLTATKTGNIRLWVRPLSVGSVRTPRSAVEPEDVG
ncbi:unnamed protein product [Peniophora sp. CBMAI 1063]|nr:unnamed protein product [Peniophora sp. CBMAI 1063]